MTCWKVDGREQREVLKIDFTNQQGTINMRDAEEKFEQ